MEPASQPQGIGMLQIGFIVFLVFLLVGAALTYFFSYSYGKKLTNNTITKGMSGLSGTTLNLQCPAGQVISFTNNNSTTTRGAMVCSGDLQCDGFYQPASAGGQTITFFNPTNTIDVFNDTSFTDIQGCSGKNQCSWQIPSQSDPRLTGCLKSCSGTLQFIGTYDCIAS